MFCVLEMTNQGPTNIRVCAKLTKTASALLLKEAMCCQEHHVVSYAHGCMHDVAGCSRVQIGQNLQQKLLTLSAALHAAGRHLTHCCPHTHIYVDLVCKHCLFNPLVILKGMNCRMSSLQYRTRRQMHGQGSTAHPAAFQALSSQVSRCTNRMDSPKR